jgi:uncharacterized protein YkwD
MRSQFVIRTIILCALMPITVNAQSLNQRIMNKINEYRILNGITPLVYEPKAKKANDQMLNYMIETATLPLDHAQRIPTSFPTTFENFIERITYLYEYKYEYIGENLCSYSDLTNDEDRADEALSLWKNSKSHNELLLNAKYTGFCVGNQVLDSIIINSITYHSPTRYVVLTMYK